MVHKTEQQLSVADCHVTGQSKRLSGFFVRQWSTAVTGGTWFAFAAKQPFPRSCQFKGDCSQVKIWQFTLFCLFILFRGIVFWKLNSFPTFQIWSKLVGNLVQDFSNVVLTSPFPNIGVSSSFVVLQTGPQKSFYVDTTKTVLGPDFLRMSLKSGTWFALHSMISDITSILCDKNASDSITVSPRCLASRAVLVSRIASAFGKSPHLMAWAYWYDCSLNVNCSPKTLSWHSYRLESTFGLRLKTMTSEFCSTYSAKYVHMCSLLAILLIQKGVRENSSNNNNLCSPIKSSIFKV